MLTTVKNAVSDTYDYAKSYIITGSDFIENTNSRIMKFPLLSADKKGQTTIIKVKHIPYYITQEVIGKSLTDVLSRSKNMATGLVALVALIIYYGNEKLTPFSRFNKLIGDAIESKLPTLAKFIKSFSNNQIILSGVSMLALIGICKFFITSQVEFFPKRQPRGLNFSRTGEANANHERTTNHTAVPVPVHVMTEVSTASQDQPRTGEANANHERTTNHTAVTGHIENSSHDEDVTTEASSIPSQHHVQVVGESNEQQHGR